MSRFGVLDKLGYPKRPCDGGCTDGCPARANCFLFLAWQVRTTMDNKCRKEYIKRLGVLREMEKTRERLEKAARKEEGLTKFEMWWLRFEHQIDPQIYQTIRDSMFTIEETAKILRDARRIINEAGLSKEEFLNRFIPKEKGEKNDAH